MVSSGNAEIGASKLAGEILSIAGRIPELVKQMTNIDLSKVKFSILFTSYARLKKLFYILVDRYPLVISSWNQSQTKSNKIFLYEYQKKNKAIILLLRYSMLLFVIITQSVIKISTQALRRIKTNLLSLSSF